LKSDKKNNYTLKTISRKINSMKTFFKFLYSAKTTKNDPAQAVKHPKYTIAPPRVLTRLEYRALRDVARANPRLYTIVELLLQTGIRIGELTRLTIEDLNLENNKKTIHIREYASNPKRDVEINEPAEAALNNYLKVRPQAKEGVNSLFVTKTGNPLLVRNVRTSISRAFEKAGIKDATVNDIRNTFIVHQLRGGMPVEIIANIVGHKRLTSTKKYLESVKTLPKRKTTKITPL
jgi:site-specific recombinase XerD